MIDNYLLKFLDQFLKENSLMEEISHSDYLIIGPGLDDRKSSIELTSKILSKYSKKCIVDAGALLPLINNTLEIMHILTILLV